MNILIDLSPLKAGGGCQLALNFIEHLSHKKIKHNYFVLIPETGPLAHLISEPGLELKFLTAPSNIYKRVLFENFNLQKILRKKKISIIYTFFGAGLPHPKNVKSIVSVAYPIICYPDSPFWLYLPFTKKVRQKLMNWGRVQRLKKADTIIAETQVMKKRLSQVLKIEKDKIVTIPPSPTEYIKDNHHKKLSNTTINFLFLSGLGFHKNLWRLPKIAQTLNNQGQENFIFTLTTNKQNYLNHLKDPYDIQIIDKYFRFTGTVSPKEIDQLYKEADYLVSLSDLESFSNNYMEAWKANVPLVVSDRDFARHICGESALYIEPHDIDKAVFLFQKILLNEETTITAKMENGKKRLAELPLQEQKMDIILELIENSI